jgi:hypothetical protein
MAGALKIDSRLVRAATVIRVQRVARGEVAAQPPVRIATKVKLARLGKVLFTSVSSACPSTFMGLGSFQLGLGSLQHGLGSLQHGLGSH